ncbi:MAG: hypothetical protein ACKOJF_35625, partial [Planctomycetaceae bacterium]
RTPAEPLGCGGPDCCSGCWCATARHGRSATWRVAVARAGQTSRGSLDWVATRRSPGPARGDSEERVFQ